MGYRSASRVPPCDQVVKGTRVPNTGLRSGGLGEHRPNTCLLGGEQVAVYFPDSVLGRQGHQLGRTGGTGYSQCPHGPHGRDMGHDRLARWRRRWASSLTWLGLGTVAMGGWTGLSHTPERRGNLFLRFRPALIRHCWGCEGNFTRSRACSRKDAKVLCARGSVDEVVTGRSARYLDIVCTSNTGALLLVSYHDDTNGLRPQHIPEGE
ncbi:hypothetical protein B0H11DRAFT_2075714 [Mycena galericulata]|nr:hypothetical protein B0H11DRAFT_2075714 [Mycena galericulata]